MVSLNGTQPNDDTVETEFLNFELTDETYEELVTLEGKRLIGASFWDSSLADDLDGEIPGDGDRVAIDLELYLADNVALEVYGAVLFETVDSGPLVGIDTIERSLVKVIDMEVVLGEIAETEDGSPVLVFNAGSRQVMLIAMGAWQVSEWEELPTE